MQEHIHAGIEQFFPAFQDPFEYEAIQLFMNTMNGFMSNSVGLYRLIHTTRQ
jgi:hypothetical protein